MSDYTEEEKEYMNYLDDLVDIPETMPYYGPLLYRGDPVAFQIGLQEYFAERR